LEGAISPNSHTQRRDLNTRTKTFNPKLHCCWFVEGLQQINNKSK